MILDSLFATLGVPGTAAILLGILAVIGTPALGSVACPSQALLRRLSPPGR